MGNTVPGVVTKMLTLVPILAAVYFYDLHNFETIFTSPGFLAIFVVAIALLVLGVYIKRKILETRLELSSTSFSWGIGLLALAAVLYVYGSYSGDIVWYHYESLYVLIVAYAAFRIGAGILRALAPLLGILGFSFLPLGLFPDLFHQFLVVLLAADVIFVFYLVYVGLRISRMVVPTLVLVIGGAGWYISSYSLHLSFPSAYLDFLIPLPVLALVVPRVRRFASLPSGVASGSHVEEEGDHRILPDGFCSICGLKVKKAKVSDNVGIWGLVAVLGVAGLLLFTTVPALAVINGVPRDVIYSSRGVTGETLPQTPSGWQVNSTALPSSQTNVYTARYVYVPTYHPETKNYTVYYGLALGQKPSFNGPFGVDVAGWNRTSNVFMQVGPLEGYLTTYVNSNRVMLAYSGITMMGFLTGPKAEQYDAGMGFVREFKNTNVSSDSFQFLGDINALWIPGFNTLVSYSTWTVFLSSMYADAESVSTAAVLILSITFIGWFVYRMSFLDGRLDQFLTFSFTLSESNWSFLSLLLKRPHHRGTAQDLASMSASSKVRPSQMDSALRELEKRHLVRTSLIERGADIISVWRTEV